MLQPVCNIRLNYFIWLYTPDDFGKHHKAKFKMVCPEKPKTILMDSY